MIIIAVVSTIVALIGIKLTHDDSAWDFLIKIGLFGLMFSIVMILSTISTLSNLKEVLTNPQRYSVVELSNANKSVAKIKRNKLFYYGINIDGIDFIELDPYREQNDDKDM